METKLRNKILTTAAISFLHDHHSKDFDLLLQDKTKQAELHTVMHDQIEQMSTLIRNVRDSKIRNWGAFDHFPDAKERKTRIKSALQMKTFKMTLNESTDEVTVSRYEKIQQVMKASSDESNYLQMASIVVECIIFVLELIGIDIPDNEEEVKKAIDEALKALRQDASLIGDVNRIQEAYINDDKIGIVKGIFSLAFDTFTEGIFLDIAKALLSDLAWYEWILTAAKIAASIAILVATEGVAEIAELLSILVDAAFFLNKLANLSKFRKHQV